jgi:hypothetical protein
MHNNVQHEGFETFSLVQEIKKPLMTPLGKTAYDTSRKRLRHKRFNISR